MRLHRRSSLATCSMRARRAAGRMFSELRAYPLPPTEVLGGTCSAPHRCWGRNARKGRRS
jgi:hypothetical protein